MSGTIFSALNLIHAFHPVISETFENVSNHIKYMRTAKGSHIKILRWCVFLWHRFLYFYFIKVI